MCIVMVEFVGNGPSLQVSWIFLEAMHMQVYVYHALLTRNVSTYHRCNLEKVLAVRALMLHSLF